MAEKLKCCPFCGISPTERNQTIDRYGTNKLGFRHWVECSICGGKSGEYSSANKSAEAWNARTATSPRSDEGKTDGNG